MTKKAWSHFLQFNRDSFFIIFILFNNRRREENNIMGIGGAGKPTARLASVLVLRSAQAETPDRRLQPGALGGSLLGSGMQRGAGRRDGVLLFN